ncbi:hypothetical protein MTR_3g014600 [Medicago truncatula]|uniref:Uncharacterized protein n=1 Tax=Medicago truncatula TaxID=3880 RepID=G7J0K2_MEDTR|nr:hypothetical protein MTR_3g014600 [Medicago truncatula]
MKKISLQGIKPGTICSHFTTTSAILSDPQNPGDPQELEKIRTTCVELSHGIGRKCVFGRNSDGLGVVRKSRVANRIFIPISVRNIFQTDFVRFSHKRSCGMLD